MTSYAPSLVFEKALALFQEIPSFYIVGRCLSGGRHYSEKLTYEEAIKEMPKYISVVNYFGGGVVDLYDKDGDIVRSSVAIEFD